mmetsp:Transcript_8640/g.15107  ORF Transcript_8640/g.15107 Transcript_8640/m.15107 type:complete len:268 (-) Transcript_8640:118-921(-)
MAEERSTTTETLDYTASNQRTLLMVSLALVLFWGQAPVAGAFSGLSTWFLHDLSGKEVHGRENEKWLLLSLLSFEASLGSFCILTLFSYFDSQSTWTNAEWLQRLIGLVICAMVVKEVQQKPKRRPKVATQNFSTLEVQVLKGRDLVAKDKNLFGKYVSSDPYIQIKHGHYSVGTTKVVRKTLNPVWEESFCFRLSQEALEECKSIECAIFDQDLLSSDDPMGEISIPLLVSQDFSITRWYTVTQGSGENYCKDAMGEVLVKVSLTR